MPLQQHLVALTAKGLVACRACGTIADVSMNDRTVKLICPTCHKTLGIWATCSEAGADLTAFIASQGPGQAA